VHSLSVPRQIGALTDPKYTKWRHVSKTTLRGLLRAGSLSVGQMETFKRVRPEMERELVQYQIAALDLSTPEGISALRDLVRRRRS